MKSVILLMVMAFGFSANAELVSDTVYGEGNSETIKQKIIKMYNEEMKNRDSNLFLALAGFAKKSDLSFMGESSDYDSGSMTVDLETNINAGGGKGGCCSYASTTLVPIWGSYKGSGLIESIIGFLRVVVYVELGEDLETTKYSIENIVPFNIN